MGLNCPRTRPLSCTNDTSSTPNPKTVDALNNGPFFSNHTSLAAATNTNRSTSFLQHQRSFSAFLFDHAQPSSQAQSRASSMESVVFFTNNVPLIQENGPMSSTASCLSMASQSQTQTQIQTQARAGQGLRRTHRVIRISSLDVSITEFRDERCVDAPPNFSSVDKVEAIKHANKWPGNPALQQSLPPTPFPATALGVKAQAPIFGTVRRQPVRKRVHWNLAEDTSGVDDGSLMDVDSGTGLGCSKWRI